MNNDLAYHYYLLPDPHVHALIYIHIKHIIIVIIIILSKGKCIFMQHIMTILHQNVHTCDRNAIEIDVRKNIQESFLTYYRFLLVKITGTKIFFLQRYIMVNVNIFCAFRHHLEYLAQFSIRAIYIYAGMQV